MSIRFLVHLSLFLWKCLGKLSGITQSCLCFFKEQASSRDTALSEQQKCFYVTFLLLLGQRFPGILHDAVTQTGHQDYFPFMVASREEGGWCLLLLLSLPTLLPPSGGEQTKTVISILQDVPSPFERTESKTCWDIKDRTMGAARCSSCHMEKIEFQRHKLPSKASC